MSPQPFSFSALLVCALLGLLFGWVVNRLIERYDAICVRLAALRRHNDGGEDVAPCDDKQNEDQANVAALSSASAVGPYGEHVTNAHPDKESDEVLQGKLSGFDEHFHLFFPLLIFSCGMFVGLMVGILTHF